MDELICPDCGGIIGATKVTDAGKPCICFKEPESSHVYTPDSVSDTSMNDTSMTGTSMSGTSLSDTSMAGKSVAKICCVCGKDVSGQKRYKDERGYWCVDCNKSDAAGHPPPDRCPECSRVVPEAALVEYAGLKMCQLCRRDREERARERKKFAKLDDAPYQALERKRAFWLIGAVAVLLVVIVLSRLKILGAFL